MTVPSLQPALLPVLRDASDTPVFPAYVGTPSAASLPLFGDDVWDLRILRVRRNQPLDWLVIDFRPFTDPVRRLVAKEYLYARLNLTHPHHRRLAPTNVKGEYYLLRRFLTYLDTAWNGVRLADVTQTILDAYLLFCRQGKKGQVVAACTVQDHILIPIKLAAYRTAFQADALQLVPWKGRSAQAVAGADRPDENTTPRIPEAVLGPLVQWALFYVQIAAKDILAARTELAGYHQAFSREAAPSRRERLEAWIAARRAAGRGLPANDTRFQHHYKEPASALNGVNCRLIGQMAGVSQVNDRFLRPLVERAAAEMGLEPGGMDTPISCHPATQQPWRNRFSPLSLHHEEYMLVAACYIVCAYVSGMRVSEILQLQRGCHFTETTADGLITRHKLRGTTFKDHGRRGVPANWVVIAPVAEAIAVLEQLTDRDELFWAQRLKPQTVPYGAVVQHTYFLKTFCEQVNRMAATGTVPIAAISEVDGAPWSLNSLQFRRTLAWHIANQPFGVVAGKIQYQHVSVATFEGYAGQSESGFRSEIEAERQLQQMEDIVDRYEDYCRGAKATGPGVAHVGRIFAEVQQELGDFPGKIVDRGRVRAMLLHLGRTLYPGLLNDCFFDPAVAHCLKAVKSETPLIAQCAPSRCPNSCISERHLPAWEQALATAKEHLSQRRLPVLQRTIIEQQMADFSRVIAPLKGATHGSEPDNRAQASSSDGSAL
jgi:integrase